MFGKPKVRLMHVMGTVSVLCVFKRGWVCKWKGKLAIFRLNPQRLLVPTVGH